MTPMRRFPFLLLGLSLLVSVAACESEENASAENAPKTNTEAQTGKTYETDPVPAPDVPMETMNRGSLNLAEEDGKVILVNFWATWCAPCRKEIPDLIDLHAEYKDDGLMVVGIAVDEEGTDVVRPFAEQHSINYPIVIDTAQTLESHFDAMYGLPTTYVVNPEGQIVRRVLGIFPVEEMEPTLQEMLQSRNKGA